jgi:hypothetical protein
MAEGCLHNSTHEAGLTMTIEQFLAGEKLTYRGFDGQTYVAAWQRRPDSMCGVPYLSIRDPEGNPLYWPVMGEAGARSFFEEVRTRSSFG